MVIAAFLRQRAISVFPYLDDWLIKRSDSQSIDFSDKSLYTNNSKSRFSSKSKLLPSQNFTFIGMEFLTAKFSQGPIGSSRDPNTDNQINSVMQTGIGTNFPFSFGQTQRSSRFCSRQTSLTSLANVPSVCLETSYSSSQSSDPDHRYDSISFTMMDDHQSLHNRNFYPPSRSQYIPLYRCQSFWMGSSFRANETFIVAGRKTNPSSISTC